MSDVDADVSDIELKELVTQTLEQIGVLGKIRAQIRAGLFLALEDDLEDKIVSFKNVFKSQIEKPGMTLLFCLVKEFLDFFDLKFTNAVFEKECCGEILSNYEGRKNLAENVDAEIDPSCDSPLLFQILNIARGLEGCKKNDKEVNVTYELPKQHVEVDKNFTDSSEITDEELCNVFDIKTTVKDNLNRSDNSSVSSVHSNDRKEIKNKSAQRIMVDDIKDDTYEGTSSIAEDSILSSKEQPLIDIDRSIKIGFTHTPSTAKSSLEQFANDKSVKSDSSLNQSLEKKKDKTPSKPMSALSSLVDLPPLQTKSRNTDTIVLPSLYSKEFREKSNLKEIDKMLDIGFESLDNYEEDFILSSSLELNRNFKIPTAVVKQDDLKKEVSSKTIMDNLVFRGNEAINKMESGDFKGDAVEDETSIIEDFEFNSTSDDYAKQDS